MSRGMGKSLQKYEHQSEDARGPARPPVGGIFRSLFENVVSGV